MKFIGKDSITNIEKTDVFDSRFLLFRMSSFSSEGNVKIIDLGELLSRYKNSELEEKIPEKPAMYANMYSPKDELQIFSELFHTALKNKEKIHIIGVTLNEELSLLENYYTQLGFMREDINCYRVDFSIPLVTVSVNIENLMWKGSDYKRMRESIFYLPPVRESSQNKALFKGINRGVIAGIYSKNFGKTESDFFATCIHEEKILPLTLGKVLYHNLKDIGIVGEKEDLIIEF